MSTNEIAKVAESTIDFPGMDASTDALAALERQAAAMSAAHKLGSVMSGTSMVPKNFQGKPDDCAAAILYGAELGLNAIQSLQNIMVINGKPGVEARTMVALLKQRGYTVETVSSSDESVTVRGTAPTGAVEESTWTHARAQKAGYTSNKLYSSIPEQMLYAKAATEVCRKLAPDVLLGMPYSKEELQLEPTRVESSRVERPSRGVAGVQEKLAQRKAEQAEPGPEQAEPEPVHINGVEMSTRSQQQKLAIVLRNEGLEDRGAKLDYLAQQFGREFTSSADLTRDEAHQLIEFLEAAQAEERTGEESSQ